MGTSILVPFGFVDPKVPTERSDYNFVAALIVGVSDGKRTVVLIAFIQLSSPVILKLKEGHQTLLDAKRLPNMDTQGDTLSNEHLRARPHHNNRAFSSSLFMAFIF